MLVELKSGETLNGHLVSCDTWMNLTLKEVIQTSPNGEKFWRLPEIYVRGSTVYLPDPYPILHPPSSAAALSRAFWGDLGDCVK